MARLWRPDAMNSINRGMAVRVRVVTGSGRALHAGADLKQVPSPTGAGERDLPDAALHAVAPAAEKREPAFKGY
jgi:enoyl-CoA hydratase/carnithine racemase